MSRQRALPALCGPRLKSVWRKQDVKDFQTPNPTTHETLDLNAPLFSFPSLSFYCSRFWDLWCEEREREKREAFKMRRGITGLYLEWLWVWKVVFCSLSKFVTIWVWLKCSVITLAALPACAQTRTYTRTHPSPHPRSPHQPILIEFLKAEKNISPGLILNIGSVVNQWFVCVSVIEHVGTHTTVLLCVSVCLSVYGWWCHMWCDLKNIPSLLFWILLQSWQEVFFGSGAYMLYRSVNVKLLLSLILV